ncbi:hypothetical protein Q3G72_024857 [Acer saccharum]|nr:hypothetical protein Q3G72_024226 [Acer saccharum]KAK1565364.1 hypothetical protein Q3G72_024857 [Acer saccharum]
MNNNHVFPTLTLHLVITISFFLIVVPVSHCQNDDHQYSNCSIPYPYRCGSSELNISYPFWGGGRPQYCGREGFEIKCHDEYYQYHFIEFENQKYGVLSMNEYPPTVTIVRDDLWYNYCPGNETRDTVLLEHFNFKYSPNDRILSFFHCQEIQPQHPDYFNFSCSAEGKYITGFYTVSVPDRPPPNLPDTCHAGIKVPVLWNALEHLSGTENLGDVVNKGFEVEYLLDITNCSACYLSGGTCGSNQSAPGQFLCYCHDHKPQMSTCPHPGMILHILSKYHGLPLCFKTHIILV